MTDEVTRVQRRLAAILAADVVGFSALMSRDEEGTHAQIKALQPDVIGPTVQRHQGRVVKTTGDGFLAEFASPAEAVRCALAVQKALTGGPLQLRIGINLGDVIIEADGDIYGDGVNVAARLEALCDPGGVLISGKVYDEADGKVEAAFESRGEQQVKNIAKPVRVFALSGAVPSLMHNQGKPLPLPDKPSIAVLPFTNMSGDPEQEYFADGVAEDIITALSRLRWLFVIARNSSFTYKGKAVDVRQVGRDLGVRYILEGSVRTSGRRIRITAQLIDAPTGKHIWAEKYDRQLDDIFEVQDEITRNVVATIEPHLYAEEGYRANSKAPETLDSWSLVVRALTLINKLGRKQNEEAQALLRKAIEIEPTYARAHAMLAWAHAWAAFCLWEERQHGFELAGQSAERALVLDPDEPWARMASGFVHSLRGQHDVALEEFAATIRLNPSFALAHTFYGVVLLRSGRFEAALDMTSKALRMSPADTFAGFYNSFHALALLVNRRFAEALLHARAAIAAFPEFPGHYNLLICCCSYLEMTDEAKAYLAHHDRIAPPLTCGGTRQRMEHFAHRDIYVEGLAKAGVPE